MCFYTKKKNIIEFSSNTNILNNKEQGIKILKELGLKENVRPEELSLKDFARISDRV